MQQLRCKTCGYTTDRIQSHWDQRELDMLRISIDPPKYKMSHPKPCFGTFTLEDKPDGI